MKRFLSLLSLLLVLSAPVLAQENNDEKDDVQDDYKYAMNGKGDQFLKIGIMPNFPMNFGDQMENGGCAILGYYRYLNQWLAIGPELMAGYNLTKGSNILTYVPVTFGVQFLPSVWKFEFPVTLSAGFAFESCQNKKYFPGLAAKAEAGVFFRPMESWSFGVGGEFYYLPQWYTTTENAESDYGTFTGITISARYHF